MANLKMQINQEEEPEGSLPVGWWSEENGFEFNASSENYAPHDKQAIIAYVTNLATEGKLYNGIVIPGRLGLRPRRSKGKP